MKNPCFISLIFIFFASCNDNNNSSVSTSTVDSVNHETSTPVSGSNEKHVNWEIGDVSYVDKIMEFYRIFDEKKSFVASDHFADTIRLSLPDVKGEIVVPNNEISKRLTANRAMYLATSNDIVSSVALRDKVTGEDWIMVTAYSKWTDNAGKKDSALFHDDWRLVNGKIDRLISFHKILPKGFVPANSNK